MIKIYRKFEKYYHMFQKFRIFTISKGSNDKNVELFSFLVSWFYNIHSVGKRDIAGKHTNLSRFTFNLK